MFTPLSSFPEEGAKLLGLPEQTSGDSKREDISSVGRRVLGTPSPTPSRSIKGRGSPIPRSPSPFFSTLAKKLRSYSSEGIFASGGAFSPAETAAAREFSTWRASVMPEYVYEPLEVDLRGIPEEEKARVREICLEEYAKANKTLEKSVGRAILRLVHKDGDPHSREAGPLLEFSRTYSRRFLDVYQAVVRYEMSKGLPMISNAAGQLKAHTFSTQEIIDMQPGCAEFVALVEKIQTYFHATLTSDDEAEEKFSLFMKLLTQEREPLKCSYQQDPVKNKVLLEFISEYERLGQGTVKKIDKVFFMMLTFAKMSTKEVLEQLSTLALDPLAAKKNESERRKWLVAGRTLSQQEYISLMEALPALSQLFSEIESHFEMTDSSSAALEEDFLRQIVFDPNFSPKDPSLGEFVERFQSLPSRELLLEVLQTIKKDKPTVLQIDEVLRQVGELSLQQEGEFEERLLMEIRHRVGGDGATFQSAPGSIGQNPLGYINAIVEGDPEGNLEAEFRQQMYFVYMSNVLTNAVMGNPELLAFLNQHLEREGKDWRMDTAFIEAMNKRGPPSLPPIFRYGPGASLNSLLRARLPHHGESLQTLKFGELQEGTVPLSANFRYVLSRRELLNQFGELDPDRIPSDSSVRFASGESFFRLRSSEEIQGDDVERVQQARRYVGMTQELRIPTTAGISGTLDQSIAMAGFVQMGLDQDPVKRREKLQIIKQALLGFMIPNNDHSVFEVLFSAFSTYGLPCHFGAGYEYSIAPDHPEFLGWLEEEQKSAGQHMPSYYLSNEFVQTLTRQEA